MRSDHKKVFQFTKFVFIISSIGYSSIFGLPRDLRRGVGLQRTAHHGLPQLRLLQVQPQVFHTCDGVDGRHDSRPVCPQEKHDPAGIIKHLNRQVVHGDPSGCTLPLTQKQKFGHSTG